MSEANPLLFNVMPPPIPVTAKDIGVQIAADSGDKQARVLVHWANEVHQYGPGESWPIQCRRIAEHMTNDECASVLSVISALKDHLEAIPCERNQAAHEEWMAAVDAVKIGLQCTCNLDNWEPEQSTGHSWVCRIHKAAVQEYWRCRKAGVSKSEGVTQ